MLFVVLPVSYVAGGPYTETYPRPFNSASWVAGSDIKDDRRCGMLADLRARVGLKGMTRREVIELLGEPQDSRSEPGISYWLLCPSFMDIWVLEVRWEGSRAAKVVVRDT